MTTATAAELPQGTMTIELTPSGYLLVQIGRKRYTKRFNLSLAEAQQLLDQLSEQLP
jgi:hypothetical protein